MLISLGTSGFVQQEPAGPTQEQLYQQKQAEILLLQQQQAQMQLLQQQQAQIQLQQQQQLQASMYGQNQMIMNPQAGAVDPHLMMQAMVMSHMAMNQSQMQPQMMPIAHQGSLVVDQYAMPPPMMNSNINTFQGNNFQANLQTAPARDDLQGLTQQEANRLPRDADDQEYPIKILCSRCKKVVTTSCDRAWGQGTYICCVVTSFAGMCFLPYFIDDCKDRVHHCPQCHSQVGLKRFKCCLCC